MAQFPYSFHNTEENRAYLGEVRRQFEAFPLAVEVRHRSWQRHEVREFLQTVGLDFCNIDQPMVSYPIGRTAWVTGPRGYLRAHGRRKESLFEFGQDRQARSIKKFTNPQVPGSTQGKNLSKQSKDWNCSTTKQTAGNLTSISRLVY